MAISDWPMEERPREKLIHRGAASLSDAELLAVFLGTGIRGRSAVELGRDLLLRYGGIRQILNASADTLSGSPGLGMARSALLLAALEIGKRYLGEKLFREGPLTSPGQAADFLIHQLRDQPREVFAVVYLDNRHQVLQYRELFYGTLSGATVHPREVVRSVIEHNAAAIIVAHNHPSGIAEPSQADTALTVKLRDALDLVDVRLLDHLVIGDGEYVSMSDLGLF